MSGTIAVGMDAGLLLLIEMGQIRLLLLWANLFCCQKSQKAQPPGIVHRGRFLSEYSLERSSGEQPHVISAREARGATQTALFPRPAGAAQAPGAA